MKRTMMKGKTTTDLEEVDEEEVEVDSEEGSAVDAVVVSVEDHGDQVVLEDQ